MKTGTMCSMLAMAVTLGVSGPQSARARGIAVFLTNTGVDADARARARFDRKDDMRQRFEVKVEALTLGEYAVCVGGPPAVGTFDVGSDGEGRLRLEGEPLGFDPRGALIEVKTAVGGEVLFSGTLPASREEARARRRVREDFVSTGVDPDARGQARYRSRRGKIRFRVKVKRMTPGTYDLLVDGSDVADMEVKAFGEGQVKFDSRFARGNKLLLTFDPLCATFAITQDAGATTFLTLDAFGSSEGLCAGSPSGAFLN